MYIYILYIWLQLWYLKWRLYGRKCLTPCATRTHNLQTHTECSNTASRFVLNFWVLSQLQYKIKLPKFKSNFFLLLSEYNRASIDNVQKWFHITWWGHQMETLSTLLSLCAGNTPHKGRWPGALMYSLICTRTNGWVNTRDDGDLTRHRAHYEVTVMNCLVYRGNFL